MGTGHRTVKYLIKNIQNSNILKPKMLVWYRSSHVKKLTHTYHDG